MESEKSWLEVSLGVDGELAEAVAEVLARFAPGGVTTEQGVAFVDDEDQGTPAGPVVVRAYLEADEQIKETRRRLEEALAYLGMIRPLPAPVYRTVADQNWMEAWKQHYRPIPVGRRLVILPAWLDPPDPARVPIRIDPGMAFGTGTHPSTQLCLELLEGYMSADGGPPEAVIDVGCGSGILAIAALKLGARSALGVDIDPQALENARLNAAGNGIGPELVLGQGSLAEVLAGDFPLRQAPLVLANILAPVLVRLLEEGLAGLLEPGGVLVLSGVLAGQAGQVEAAARRAGLSLDRRTALEDWVALALRRPPGRA
jgi:ribosomal protein L11 methyltransferase